MPDQDTAQDGSTVPCGEQDHYAVLGVARDAATADIIRAFRVLARGYHPDVRPGDPAAVGQFRRLALAYEVLTDPVRRAAYDRAHPPRQPEAGHQAGPRASSPARITVRAAPRSGDPPLRAGPVYHTPPPR